MECILDCDDSTDLEIYKQLAKGSPRTIELSSIADGQQGASAECAGALPETPTRAAARGSQSLASPTRVVHTPRSIHRTSKMARLNNNNANRVTNVNASSSRGTVGKDAAVSDSAGRVERPEQPVRPTLLESLVECAQTSERTRFDSAATNSNSNINININKQPSGREEANNQVGASSTQSTVLNSPALSLASDVDSLAGDGSDADTQLDLREPANYAATAYASRGSSNTRGSLSPSRSEQGKSVLEDERQQTSPEQHGSATTNSAGNMASPKLSASASASRLPVLSSAYSGRSVVSPLKYASPVLGPSHRKKAHSVPSSSTTAPQLTTTNGNKEDDDDDSNPFIVREKKEARRKSIDSTSASKVSEKNQSGITENSSSPVGSTNRRVTVGSKFASLNETQRYELLRMKSKELISKTSKLKKADEEISALKKDNSILREQLDKVNSKMSTLTKDNRNKTQRIQQLQSKVALLESKLKAASSPMGVFNGSSVKSSKSTVTRGSPLTATMSNINNKRPTISEKGLNVLSSVGIRMKKNTPPPVQSKMKMESKIRTSGSGMTIQEDDENMFARSGHGEEVTPSKLAMAFRLNTTRSPSSPTTYLGDQQLSAISRHKYQGPLGLYRCVDDFNLDGAQHGYAALSAGDVVLVTRILDDGTFVVRRDLQQLRVAPGVLEECVSDEFESSQLDHLDDLVKA